MVESKVNGNLAQKPLLIFDGDCGFCTSTANWIQRNSQLAIEIEPYQWSNLDSFGLTEAEASAKVQLVAQGKIFAGHYCMAKLLMMQSNALLRVLGALMVLPAVNWLSAKVYDLIAANRHKLPGDTPACKMPPSR